LAAANRGTFSEFTARLSPHLEVIQPHGDWGGANLLLRNLRAEHERGARRRPVNVVVGGDVLIWETELIDLSNNSTGGPSAAAWVMSLDPNGLVQPALAPGRRGCAAPAASSSAHGSCKKVHRLVRPVAFDPAHPRICNP
jgi:hypothetical protein